MLRTVTPATPARWLLHARPGPLLFAAAGGALLAIAVLAGGAIPAITSIGLGMAGGALLWRVRVAR